MAIETYNMSANGKEIVFSRPYLNDQKELTFLHCSEFSRFPNMKFVLREEEKSIELCEPTSKKKVFLLLKGNDNLLKNATEKKESILDLLRSYTKRLKLGEEKILVFVTGNKKYPYYFTTVTVLDHGSQSSKFIAGFMYFINQHLSEKGETLQFEKFDDMQHRLSGHFSGVGFKEFDSEQVDGKEVYAISLKKFLELLT